MRIADDICDGEILSLRGATIRRSCEQCASYWKIMWPNDCVWFKASVVLIDGVDQTGIKAVLILDGTELCTVDFLGKNISALKKTSDKFVLSDKFVNMFTQVIELYDSRENAAKRAKSHNNLGVCSFRHLEDIQIQE